MQCMLNDEATKLHDNTLRGGEYNLLHTGTTVYLIELLFQPSLSSKCSFECKLLGCRLAVASIRCLAFVVAEGK